MIAFALLADTDVIQGLLDGSPGEAREVDGWLSQVLTYHGWGGRIDADDVRQKAWLALLTALRDGRRPDGPLKPYTQGICKKLCLLGLRQSYQRQTVDLEAIEPIADKSNPEKELLDAQRYGRFLKVFGSLKFDCKRLLVWRFIKNLSSEDIAEKLGIASGAARKRLHSCLKQAREKAGDSGF